MTKWSSDRRQLKQERGAEEWVIFQWRIFDHVYSKTDLSFHGDDTRLSPTLVQSWKVQFFVSTIPGYCLSRQTMRKCFALLCVWTSLYRCGCSSRDSVVPLQQDVFGALSLRLCPWSVPWYRRAPGVLCSARRSEDWGVACDRTDFDISGEINLSFKPVARWRPASAPYELVPITHDASVCRQKLPNAVDGGEVFFWTPRHYVQVSPGWFFSSWLERDDKTLWAFDWFKEAEPDWWWIPYIYI